MCELQQLLSLVGARFVDDAWKTDVAADDRECLFEGETMEETRGKRNGFDGRNRIVDVNVGTRWNVYFTCSSCHQLLLSSLFPIILIHSPPLLGPYLGK